MMTGRERVSRTFRRLETDKVPKGELWGVDNEMARSLLDQKGISYSDDFEVDVRIREMLRFDLMDVGIGAPSKKKIGEDGDGNCIFKDIWGRTQLYPRDNNGAWVLLEPGADTPEGMAELAPPSLDCFSMEAIKRWRQETDFFVFSCIWGHFGPSMTLFGIEDFFAWCLTEESMVHSWLEKYCDLNIRLAERQIESGADGILYGDDMAYNKGTLVSPDVLRRLFFPYMKKVVQFIKSKGVPVILHSDGYLMDVIPDFIDMGLDGIQSIEPTAGMDIAKIKKEYGKDLVLMGNVDIDLLGRGTPEQVACVVKRLMREVAPGGGYILSSSNQLCRGTLPENALAMYETAEEHGWYTRLGCC